MEKDYKEKIRKLLALAESSNEHEAKSALLKARELMAEHKLSQDELKEIEKKEVRDIDSGVTCSKRRDPWAYDLASIISEHYCCRGYREHGYGKQTQKLHFVGLEDDAEICVAVFRYAVDCIRSGIKEIKEKYSEWSEYCIKRKCNGYGYGFVWGIYDALEEQEKEKEKSEEGWGLVLQCPQEVKDYLSENCTRSSFRAKAKNEVDAGYYFKGLDDGRKWKPEQRIESV